MVIVYTSESGPDRLCWSDKEILRSQFLNPVWGYPKLEQAEYFFKVTNNMQISQGGYDQDMTFTCNSKPLPGINIFLHSFRSECRSSKKEHVSEIPTSSSPSLPQCCVEEVCSWETLICIDGSSLHACEAARLLECLQEEEGGEQGPWRLIQKLSQRRRRCLSHPCATSKSRLSS